MSIRLVVAEADDASLVLKDLEALVQQVPDVEVVARCQSGEATLQAVRQHRPDVVVLTIGMPGPGDLEVLRQMRQDQPPTPVVLLAASLPDDALLEAMRLGIGGWSCTRRWRNSSWDASARCRRAITGWTGTRSAVRWNYCCGARWPRVSRPKA
jgi:CheY-like chemotaxis protein